MNEPMQIPAGWYPDPAGVPGQFRYWDGAAWAQAKAPKRPHMLWIALAAGVAGLLMIYIAAAPYITVYRMKSAAESHDGETLSEFIDFPSVRQSLKDQMNAILAKEMASDPETADNPFAAIGSALAGTLAEKMVDAYVTPAGITRLMSGGNMRPGDTKSTVDGRDPFSNAAMSYESVDRFAVTVKDDEGEDMKFVLRRRGLSWKLTDIIVPEG